MKAKKILMIFTITFILTNCSHTEANKQKKIVENKIIVLDKNFSKVKEDVIETKKVIKEIKTKQPECKVQVLEEKIHKIENQTTVVQADIDILKTKIETGFTLAHKETEFYKSKAAKYLVSFYFTIIVSLLILLNKIDVNGIFTSILSKIKNFLIKK